MKRKPVQRPIRRANVWFVRVGGWRNRQLLNDTQACGARHSGCRGYRLCTARAASASMLARIIVGSLGSRSYQTDIASFVDGLAAERQ